MTLEKTKVTFLVVIKTVIIPSQSGQTNEKGMTDAANRFDVTS
jgi:hypothetical protein